MKKNYLKPIADPVLYEPGSMLAASDSFSGSGEDVIFDTDSDFDSFFGA